MPIIHFKGESYTCKEGESVLLCLRRHGQFVPYSCQAGACQSCKMVCTEGDIPATATASLKDTQKAQGQFLACICKPKHDLHIRLASVIEDFSSQVLSKHMLNDQVLALQLSIPEGFSFTAGQFINIKREADGLSRSYSIASLPSDDSIHLHIKLIPRGKMSNWLADDVSVGDSLNFAGPLGDCYYVSEAAEQNLLLAGVGTGLAPLLGIARDALAKGHQQAIHLCHGSVVEAGLYLMDELRSLEQQYPQFHYHPCVLQGEASEGVTVSAIDTFAPSVANGDLKGWRAFLCGDPPLVDALNRSCFLAGISMAQIYSDPFVPAAQ